jgi:hypothetical protein
LLHDNELLATTTEEDELALLRAENALLKKKLKALEKGGRGDKPGL